MGKIENGIIPFSGSFALKVAGDIDDRARLQFKADLTDPETWKVEGTAYVSAGQRSLVLEDTAENNGLYYLKVDDYTDIANWDKIGSGGGTWGSITGTLSTQTDLQTALDAKVAKTNVLTLDNTTAFTPDEDYEPATKKYVDDTVGGGGSARLEENIIDTASGTILMNKNNIIRYTGGVYQIETPITDKETFQITPDLPTAGQSNVASPSGYSLITFENNSVSNFDVTNETGSIFTFTVYSDKTIRGGA